MKANTVGTHGSLLGAASLYADKMNFGAFAAWFLTLLIVLFGYRYAREAVSGLLMKLYEILIQKHAMPV